MISPNADLAKSALHGDRGPPTGLKSACYRGSVTEPHARGWAAVVAGLAVRSSYRALALRHRDGNRPAPQLLSNLSTRSQTAGYRGGRVAVLTLGLLFWLVSASPGLALLPPDQGEVMKRTVARVLAAKADEDKFLDPFSFRASIPGYLNEELFSDSLMRGANLKWPRYRVEELDNPYHPVVDKVLISSSDERIPVQLKSIKIDDDTPRKVSGICDKIARKGLLRYGGVPIRLLVNSEAVPFFSQAASCASLMTKGIKIEDSGVERKLVDRLTSAIWKKYATVLDRDHNATGDRRQRMPDEGVAREQPWLATNAGSATSRFDAGPARSVASSRWAPVEPMSDLAQNPALNVTRLGSAEASTPGPFSRLSGALRITPLQTMGVVTTMLLLSGETYHECGAEFTLETVDHFTADTRAQAASWASAGYSALGGDVVGAIVGGAYRGGWIDTAAKWGGRTRDSLAAFADEQYRGSYVERAVGAVDGTLAGGCRFMRSQFASAPS